MFCTWRATVCSLMTRVEAISLLLLPLATQTKHLELPRRQPVQVVGHVVAECVDTGDIRRCPELLEGGS